MRALGDALELAAQLEACLPGEALQTLFAVKAAGPAEEGMRREIAAKVLEKKQLEHGIREHLHTSFDEVPYPPHNVMLRVNCDLLRVFSAKVHSENALCRRRDFQLRSPEQFSELSGELSAHIRSLSTFKDEWLI